MVRMCLAVLAIVVGCGLTGSAQTAQASKDAKTSKTMAIVNLNTATMAELEALPGIGARVAERIIEYRTQKGPFKKIEEILEKRCSGPDLLVIFC
jgi:competence ComEA-like helix-hairpin-helix protein